MSQVTPTQIPIPIPFRQPGDIECWGHRGASAHLPENTLASFRAAIKEGCDGIESDVHATSDGVILMFHDPTLDRTTTGKGLIKNQPWKGVIEHVRTTKEPIQPIPLFEELIALLMEPENRHVTLNIDCKMQNDPEKLFPEMARIISKYPNHSTLLSPRLILGLWHPLFIPPSMKYLPNCTRYHIGFSLPIIREYFWDHCSGFSLAFSALMNSTGQAFLNECREKGKEVTVWTVNHELEMKTAIGWGVKAVLTDRVGRFVELKNEIIDDPSKLNITGLSKLTFPWSSWRYYTLAHVITRSLVGMYLKAHGQMYITPIPTSPSDDNDNDNQINSSPSTTIITPSTDVMRTMCYQPGPIEKPDLSEFSMVNDADQHETELPSTSPDQPLSASTIGKIDSGVEDIRLETSDMKGNGLLGKVAA